MTSRPGTDDVFRCFEQRFPASWRADRWYLSAIGTLVGCGRATARSELYAYLVRQPAFRTPAQRRALVRRMREALVKLVIVNGIPAAMAAVLSIAARETEEDKDYSRTRLDWKPDDAHEQRGLAMLDTLYQADFPLIMRRFHAHRDLEWLTRHVSYGLFLSDFSVLDLVDTELAVWPAIMCQRGLAGPALWHVRCCLRAGVAREDVSTIQSCIGDLARWAGKNEEEIAEWPRVEQVKENLSNL